MTKPAPLAPLSVSILLGSDLDTRVYWGPHPDIMHALTLHALDLPPHPRAGGATFMGKATVTSDGHLLCDYLTADGEPHAKAHAGTIQQLANYADYLTRELQLTDAMDLTLRQALDASIGTSYEAQPTKFSPQSH